MQKKINKKGINKYKKFKKKKNQRKKMLNKQKTIRGCVVTVVNL